MITFDDFQKMDLRIAQVEAAREHPNADKLLVLDIDIGGEKRTIVAGIRATHDPAALVGRKILVVTNLAPAKLRGVESHGMLLAAVDGEKISLLVPEEDVTTGTKVG